jgi:hypothetical protein
MESQLTLTASRFFRRKADKVKNPPPASSSNASSSTLVVGDERGIHRDSAEGASSTSSTFFPFLQVPSVPSNPSGNNNVSLKIEDDLVKLKPRPSFATLRSKSALCYYTFIFDLVLMIFRLASVPQQAHHQ